MMLAQSCSIQQRLNLDGLTQSVFRRVDRWLNETSDHQRALEFVARRKNMDRYMDRIDFLFCETYPEWQRRCFAWYEDADGCGQLRDQSTKKERDVWERQLLLVLEVAYEVFCDKRRASWGWTKVIHEARRRAA